MFVFCRLAIRPQLRLPSSKILWPGVISHSWKVEPISFSNQKLQFLGFGTKMARPKILVTRGDIPAVGLDILREKCDLEIWQSLSPIPRSELLKKIVGVDGVYCLLTDPIDEQVLAAAGHQLKVVSTMSVGYDHLELKALRARNIRVGYTPGVLTDATSELTVALLLATSRRLLEADRATRAGEWKAWSPSFMCGPGLAGSTIGIVGLGAIGTRIAQLLSIFRVAKIVYTSRSEKKEQAREFGGERVSFDDLLGISDFVIVTTALTPETRELFNAEAFRKMKKSAIFINVSRGQVVDQPALIEALKNNRIRAAGLDVMTPEPIPLDSELLRLHNCVVMPHLGSATIETRAEMARMTAKNIMAVLNGEPANMPAELDLKSMS